jgi:hypothetical protein
MIITRAYAKKLIRSGKADEVAVVYDYGRHYIAILRYDQRPGRTDHYQINREEAAARATEIEKKMCETD